MKTNYKYLGGTFALLTFAILSFIPPQSHAQTQNVNTNGTRGSTAIQHLSESADQSRLKATYGRLPLMFEENQSQASNDVRFLSRGSGYSLFLTDDEAVLNLGHLTDSRGGTSTRSNSLSAPDVLRLKLVGANPKARVEGQEQQAGKTN